MRDVTPKDTSRIAAQHAKAEINAIVRNAAREQIYEEFSKRVGELITGTVLQTTPEFTILKIREGVEAELPHFDKRRHPEERNERPGWRVLPARPARPRYHYRRARSQGRRLRHRRRAASTAVRPSSSPARTPISSVRLFELEVPEVYDGVVEIKAIAREPGTRSKVAVHSLDQHLDPVGACVGPKGSRVRMVVSELRGERIDVVLWNADPATYVANALSPAKVTRVLADTENQYATVIVPDDQLSLAIGKEGQNARLAARLTGWHIDIKNESLAANLQLSTPLIDALGGLDEEDGARCEYVDAEGVRCRNQARPGSRFCGVHEHIDDDSLI